MFYKQLLPVMCVVLLAVASACSANNPPAPAAVPTATAAAAPAVPATETLPPSAPTNTAAPTQAASTAAPQPTETSTLPASIPTGTLTSTPQARATAATARPRQTAAPLEVSYQVIEVKRKQGEDATLVMKVNATGGSGGYKYYNDETLQPNATFNIAGTCGKPFVHTIKVTSGDGQTMAMPYHVNGICPTPTP